VRQLFAACCLVLAAHSVTLSSAAEASVQSRTQPYVVVWRVDLDAAGNMIGLAVERVLDPARGGTPEEIADNPIQLDVPQRYVDAVRQFLTRRNSGRRDMNPYYTFTFYDPNRPDRVVEP
jgi:hypothetical protein